MKEKIYFISYLLNTQLKKFLLTAIPPRYFIRRFSFLINHQNSSLINSLSSKNCICICTCTTKTITIERDDGNTFYTQLPS